MPAGLASLGIALAADDRGIRVVSFASRDLVAGPADWLIGCWSTIEVLATLASLGVALAADYRRICIVSCAPSDLVARPADWLIGCWSTIEVPATVVQVSTVHEEQTTAGSAL